MLHVRVMCCARAAVAREGPRRYMNPSRYWHQATVNYLSTPICHRKCQSLGHNDHTMTRVSKNATGMIMLKSR